MSTAGARLGSLKKAREITDAMDAAMLCSGTNPFSAVALTKLLGRLESMTPEDWSAFFVKYMPGRNFKTPDQSLVLIIDHFRARLAHVQSSRRDPVSDVA